MKKLVALLTLFSCLNTSAQILTYNYFTDIGKPLIFKSGTILVPIAYSSQYQVISPYKSDFYLFDANLNLIEKKFFSISDKPTEVYFHDAVLLNDTAYYSGSFFELGKGYNQSFIKKVSDGFGVFESHFTKALYADLVRPDSTDDFASTSFQAFVSDSVDLYAVFSNYNSFDNEDTAASVLVRYNANCEPLAQEFGAYIPIQADGAFYSKKHEEIVLGNYYGNPLKVKLNPFTVPSVVEKDCRFLLQGSIIEQPTASGMNYLSIGAGGFLKKNCLAEPGWVARVDLILYKYDSAFSFIERTAIDSINLLEQIDRGDRLMVRKDDSTLYAVVAARIPGEPGDSDSFIDGVKGERIDNVVLFYKISNEGKVLCKKEFFANDGYNHHPVQIALTNDGGAAVFSTALNKDDPNRYNTNLHVMKIDNACALVGLKEIRLAKPLAVYPNPVKSSLSIPQTPENLLGSNYRIVSSTGALVQEGTLSSLSLELGHLAAGSYVFYLSSPNGTNYQASMVKE